MSMSKTSRKLSRFPPSKIQSNHDTNKIETHTASQPAKQSNRLIDFVLEKRNHLKSLLFQSNYVLLLINLNIYP